jgi:hypothetical protein
MFERSHTNDTAYIANFMSSIANISLSINPNFSEIGRLTDFNRNETQKRVPLNFNFKEKQKYYQIHSNLFSTVLSVKLIILLKIK